MKIEYEGEQYHLDMDTIDVKQAIKIEKHIGGTLEDWETGMSHASTACLQALGWLIFTGGDSTPIADVNFKIMALSKRDGRKLEVQRKPQRRAGAGGASSRPSSSPSPATYATPRRRSTFSVRRPTS